MNQRGPGNRQMKAIWREDGHVLEMNAAVPDLAAFKERLGWLHKVDSQTWLDAMPAKVVKAADHNATVREVLKGSGCPATSSRLFRTPASPPDGDQLPGRSPTRLSLVPQWGEAAGRRPSEETRSRAGDGDLQKLADPASDGEGRRLSRKIVKLVASIREGTGNGPQVPVQAKEKLRCPRGPPAACRESRSSSANAESLRHRRACLRRCRVAAGTGGRCSRKLAPEARLLGEGIDSAGGGDAVGIASLSAFRA